MKIYLKNREVIEVSDKLGLSIARSLQRYKFFTEYNEWYMFKYKKEKVLIIPTEILVIQ